MEAIHGNLGGHLEGRDEPTGFGDAGASRPVGCLAAIVNVKRVGEQELAVLWLQ
jgi:hypothetical protein